LTEAVNILEKTPKAGMVLSSLIKPDKKTIEGTSGWFSKKYCIFGQNKTDIEKDTLTTHAGMGSVLVRSDLLREFKIEEKYFLYYEGIDLSLRMWLSGYEIVACPKSILYHFHRGSVNRNFKNHEIDRLVVRNNLLVFLRFYPLKWILLYMPTYLWDRGIIFSGRLMRRELLRAIAIPMGLIDGILEWKWIIQMRSKTPNKERIEEVLNKLDKLGVKEKCAWRIGL
jgi:GT2 family glycosyltransferase